MTLKSGLSSCILYTVVSYDLYFRFIKLLLHEPLSTAIPRPKPNIILRLTFFINDTSTNEIYTLSLHDALPILISVTFRRVIRTNHKKASKIWRHENIQLGGCQS